MKQTLDPSSRRWDIVVLVARRGPITLAELAREMGLARTSMQQQVGRLVAEGWLDRSRLHGKPGRPADVFSLSEPSRRLFAPQASGFARILMEEIAETEGESKLRALVKGVGRRLTRKLRERVGQGAPLKRAERLAALLSEEGVISDVTRPPRRLKLTIHTCPYHGLSKEYGVLCDMDRELVSRLVGARARASRRIANGHPRCEFEWAMESDGATTRSRE